MSEGRYEAWIDEMADALASPPGVRVVDVSSDPDHHRTVFSAVACGADLEDGLLAMSETALRRLDLRSHRGVHPRLGVIDVVPIVPLGEASMDEAIGCADAVAARMASELGLPVYLYGEAARRSARRRPAQLRRLGLDGVAAAAASGKLTPDFGPTVADPSRGVTLVGARGAMVAFNAVLNTHEVEIARAIAACVRESSGGLPGVQALGFLLESRSLTQVSMNVFAPFTATLSEIAEEVGSRARSLGTSIAELEVVGLVPEQALRSVSGEVVLPEGVDPQQVLETATALP